MLWVGLIQSLEWPQEEKLRSARGGGILPYCGGISSRLVSSLLAGPEDSGLAGVPGLLRAGEGLPPLPRKSWQNLGA